MERLDHIHVTTLSSNGHYEVSDVERMEESDSEIVQLREELDAERERGLRMLAEFDNYRRRTRQENALAKQTGKREVLLALLELMDDFDRALFQIDNTSDAVGEGLRLIRGRFNEVLRSNGVAAFESQGQPFDPMVHEAISVIDTDDASESDKVFAEERRGYLMNGQLLRPARVTVFKVTKLSKVRGDL